MSSPPRTLCIRAKQRQPTDAADAIVTIDGRTNLGRAARLLRDGLVRHVGGSPNHVQTALIERIIQIKLRITAMDADFAHTGSMSEHATKSYLAWSNSYVRALNTLGLKAAPEPAASLTDIVGEHARRAAQAPRDVRGTTPAPCMPLASSAPARRDVATPGSDGVALDPDDK